MKQIESVRQKVAELYEQQDPNRDEWADWLYENHVLWVAQRSRELAEKYNADADIAEAAALLHDVADSVMARRNDNHEAESLRMARELLREVGCDDDQIALIVDDADKFHSCHNGEKPSSKEGLVLAAADAMAHFQTGFYPFAVYNMHGRGLDVVKCWVLAKLDRDFYDKIVFDDERAAVKPVYETLKQLFS